MPDPIPIVVSPDWLAQHRDEVRAVDVRDAWEFDGIGHIPGAVNVPFDAYRGAGESDEGHLPGVERFEALLGDAGITPSDRLVAYDDEHGVFAARFVVTALLYGHAAVHLLDGDFSAWSRSFEVTAEPTPVEPTAYHASVPADRPLVDAATVRRAADDPTAVVIDTRTPEEFAAGHIDGAINLDWREFVDPETRGLKPPDELTAILGGIGATPDNRVVLYCNTARRISHTYVVLRFLGYDAVDFYEGSLTDWTARGLELTASGPD